MQLGGEVKGFTDACGTLLGFFKDLICPDNLDLYFHVIKMIVK